MSKLRSWNVGPQLADSTLAVLRHRHNVRAGTKHRPDYPDLGHYDHHIVDKIQVVSKDIYGFAVHRWWKPISSSM